MSQGHDLMPPCRFDPEGVCRMVYPRSMCWAQQHMKPNQCRQNETAWIGRWLGDRPLQLLDFGKAALESAGHF
jgi:hypothetical protein